MRQPEKAKKNIPLRLAAVLLCLVLVTTYLMAGLLARYTIQNSGSDSAQVAAFAPTASISTANGTILYDAARTEDYTVTYTITVKNPSEVAVDYDLKVSFADTTLNDAQISLDGGSGHSIDGTDIDYGSMGRLNANDTTGATHTLTFTVTKAFVENLISTASGSVLDLSALFTATVTFTQVD